MKLTSADYSILVRILAHVEEPFHPELMAEVPRLKSLLAQLGNAERNAEEAAADEEARRSQAIPQVVPDWVSVKQGTLVKRSRHYLQQTHNKQKAEQVGIVSKIQLFNDDLCGVVAFPVIHWQGEPFGNINHPMNACLADGTELPKVTMNANQQTDKKI